MNFTLASLVSAALMGAFSTETETNFMTSCSAGAEKAVCSCVLKKIESKYSEIEFKQMESFLVSGKEVPEYMDFLVNARLECNNAGKSAGSTSGSIVAVAGAAQPKVSKQTQVLVENNAPTQAESTKTGFVLSQNDLMVLQVLLSNKTFKTNFVDECFDEAEDILGKKQAQKSCKCAYDRLVKDETLLYKLIGTTNAKGEVDDFDKWGYDLISPCLPENFTPEIEKAFMKECTDDYKGNKKSCKCAFDEIKKNYTVQSLLQAEFLNEKKLKNDMINVVGKCLAK